MVACLIVRFFNGNVEAVNILFDDPLFNFDVLSGKECSSDMLMLDLFDLRFAFKYTAEFEELFVVFLRIKPSIPANYQLGPGWFQI